MIFACFTTWKRGRTELAERFAASALTIENFLKDLERHPVTRVRGTAVFLSSSTTLVSPVLLHHLKHNQVLHEQVILLSVLPLNVPEVPIEERVQVEPLGQGFQRLVAKYGYRQNPRVPEILRRARSLGLQTKPEMTSFYVGRETVLPRGRSRMARWRKVLFPAHLPECPGHPGLLRHPARGALSSWGCRSTYRPVVPLAFRMPRRGILRAPCGTGLPVCASPCRWWRWPPSRWVRAPRRRSSMPSSTPR